MTTNINSALPTQDAGTDGARMPIGAPDATTPPLEPINSNPFQRFVGAEGLVGSRMPAAVFNATTSPRTVGELLSRLEQFTSAESEWRTNYPWATRFVMGYPLPSWQRALVWTEEQKVRFITSLWLDVDVGSYLVNDWFEFVTDTVMEEFSTVLLDGQQRLSALQSYVLNEFPVPDKDGLPCYWQELSKTERRKFGNKAFSMSRVVSNDEQTLRTIYDLRNFGGTVHLEHERASTPGTSL